MTVFKNNKEDHSDDVKLSHSDHSKATQNCESASEMESTDRDSPLSFEGDVLVVEEDDDEPTPGRGSSRLKLLCCVETGLPLSGQSDPPIRGNSNEEYCTEDKKPLWKRFEFQVGVVCFLLLLALGGIIWGAVGLTRNNKDNDKGVPETPEPPEPPSFTVVQGDEASSRFGLSVALSNNRLVVGAPQQSTFEGFVNKAGQLHMFEYFDGKWEQGVGEAGLLRGMSEGQGLGVALDISKDAKTLVVGSPLEPMPHSSGGSVQVYNLHQEAFWIPRGTKLVARGQDELLGASVGLSDDGNIYAVGGPAFSNDRGIVRVLAYSEDNEDWILRGDALEGPTDGAKFGSSLALSPDGNRLIVGSPGSTPLTGSAHVFRYQTNTTAETSAGTWVPMGQVLGEEATGTLFGASVSLSKDAIRIAVSSPLGGTNQAGVVYIYEWSDDEEKWTLVGEPIEDQAVAETGGQSIALAPNGNRIAIGASRDSNGAGRVRVFDYNQENNRWLPASGDLEGASKGDRFGFSVSWDEGGERLAAGSPYGTTEEEFGYVRVIEY